MQTICFWFILIICFCQSRAIHDLCGDRDRLIQQIIDLGFQHMKEINELRLTNIRNMNSVSNITKHLKKVKACQK